MIGSGWCWSQGRALSPAYPTGCQQWYQSTIYFLFPTPCSTAASAQAAMAHCEWPDLAVSKSRHKSSSLLLRHSQNQLHWCWLTQHPCTALQGCPSLLRQQRCYRTCPSPKALLSGCSLKTVTIFYSNSLSSQNPHWLLISQIYPVPLWALC